MHPLDCIHDCTQAHPGVGLTEHKLWRAVQYWMVK